jgi:serine/threonine kinase PknH
MNEPHGDLTDNDTAPLPPISDEPWGPTGGEPLQPFTDFSSSFAAPPSRDRSPAGTSHRRTIRRVIGSAAAAIVAVGIVGAVLMLRPDPAGTEVEAPAEAADSGDSGDSGDLERLRRLLPSGFADEACQPDAPGPDTAAQVVCGANTDAGGPATARFLLAAPGADLQVLLRSSLAGAEVVTCPGRIQSPGPWRRNATPNQVAGTLICATRGDLATVAWTTDEKNLVNVAAGGQNGPTLAQLYTWWSSHS